MRARDWISEETLRRKLRVRLVTAAVVAALTAAFAVPASAIANGTVDSEDEFPFIAFAVLILPDGAWIGCSAAAIDADHLITAAHCFQPALPPEVGGPPNQPVEGILVFYGHDLNEPEVAVTGTWHPVGFCPFCDPGLLGVGSGDLAVIKLSEPVELDRYVTLPDVGLADTLPRHARVMLAGYGVHGFAPGGGPLAGNALFDGVRRLVPAELINSKHRASDELLRISASPNQGTGGSCFGDSGSPAMYKDGAEWVALGVSSYVTNGLCRGVSYYNRIDSTEALSFIYGFVD